MKKQILSVFLVLMFILAGCGGDKPAVTEPFSSEYTDSSDSNTQNDSQSEIDDIFDDSTESEDNSTDEENESSEITSSDDNTSSDLTSSKDETSKNTSTDVQSKPDSETTKPAGSNSSKNDVSSNTSSKKENFEISGGDTIYENLLDDGSNSNSNSGFQIVVEKDMERNTLNTAWRNFNNCPATSVVEEQAQKMREDVLNTGNTEEFYSWRGRTFYLSPDGDDNNDGLTPETAIKTLDADAINLNPPKSGDAVLFERGGIWRISSAIRPKDGVIYGSYGEGPKPALYGSPYNYGDTKYWSPSNKQYVWKVSVATQDVGSITFNGGELMGDKKMNGITVLEKNGDFYYNQGDDTLYVYCKDGNPGKVYEDIELGVYKTAISIGRDDVVIDNLCVKFFGCFGISTCDNDNLKVTNCEFGFIGGCIQSGTLRYGNCIQQWNSTDKQLIHNNWMYQAYDTGYTWQGSDTYEPGLNDKGETRIGDKVYYNNITVTKNIIEYCNYAIEFWHNTKPELMADDYDEQPQIENFVLSDNMFRYSGYGWGGIQRPDKWGYAVYGGGKAEKRNAKNCEIKNNVFDMSLRVLVRWEQRTMEYMSEDRWQISGNSFYQTGNQYCEALAFVGQSNASSQDGLVNAMSKFDPNYKEIKWLEND